MVMIARAARTAVAAALLAVQALPVSARCPVSADLTTGVRFVYDDDTSEVYRAGPGVDVIVDGYTGDRLDRRLALRRGVFLTRFVSLISDPEATESGRQDAEDPGSVVLYQFPDGDEPPLARASHWRGKVIVSDSTGSHSEWQDHQSGRVERMDIGGCVYDVLPIEVDYGEDAAYAETLVFIPELGLGYLAAYANDGAEPRQLTVTTLEALE